MYADINDLPKLGKPTAHCAKLNLPSKSTSFSDILKLHNLIYDIVAIKYMI